MYNDTTLGEAKQLVLPDEGVRKIYIPYGDTGDIIYAIKEADKESAKFTRDFAPLFNSSSQLLTCKRVFDFVLQNITHQVDATGTQLVKSPSQTVHTGIADCKSMGLLVGSLLKNLGIKFRYRLTAYTASRAKSKLVSHIYCVAMIYSGDVAMDTVWQIFDSEKPYLYHHKDLMPEVSYVAGINTNIFAKKAIKNRGLVIATSAAGASVLVRKSLQVPKILKNRRQLTVGLFGTEDDYFIGEIETYMGFSIKFLFDIFILFICVFLPK